jgi:hypothetical protein
MFDKGHNSSTDKCHHHQINLLVISNDIKWFMSNETEANFSDIFAYFSVYNSIKVNGIMSKIN